MTKKSKLFPPPKIKIERISSLKPGDLDDLCDAAESAIIEGGGFGWLKVPPRKVLENYWKGVLTIPERELIIIVYTEKELKVVLRKFACSVL